MPQNIRDAIVAKRRMRLAELGPCEGAAIPEHREAPLTPFLGANGLICEVKRRSPSKGDIAPGLDAVAQAGLYRRAGCANFSVLTEPTGFGGSLDDLMAVKRAYPDAAVLRKDFLFDPRDIEVSYRAGADAVLLIAGMLSREELHLLHGKATALGLTALVEIHDRSDLEKARTLRPNLLGFNSRDLTSFRLDPMLPLRVKSGIDWPARVVYESGIFHPEQAHFAVSSGFYGILVGESVVRDPGLPGRLLETMRAAPAARFWPEVGRRLAAASGVPLVKICGLTRERDARTAVESGADILGFVFWPRSARCARPEVVRALGDVKTLKVGVVVTEPGAKELDPVVRQLLEDGLLDAVQFHGAELPEDCFTLWPVYYKAVRPTTGEDVVDTVGYRCPRLLVDASGALPGGTGRTVADDILDRYQLPLWLAGGLTPDNAARIVGERRPELMDTASGVEDAPGIKNEEKMRQFIMEIRNA